MKLGINRGKFVKKTWKTDFEHPFEKYPGNAFVKGVAYIPVGLLVAFKYKTIFGRFFLSGNRKENLCLKLRNFSALYQPI